jgi:hypothetical protein
MNNDEQPNGSGSSLRWLAVGLLAFATTFLLQVRGIAQEPVKSSGFLGSYAGLESRPDPVLAEHYVYVNRSTNWKNYSGIVIEPVTIFLKTGGQAGGFSPHDIAALTEYFEQALLRELSGVYPLQKEARPGVLHLRIAITELMPTRPRQSKTGDFIPLLLIARGLKGKSLAVNVSSIAIESELLDAATGERLAAVKSKKVGTVSDPAAESSNSVEEVEEAMDFWAKRVRAFLESARAPASSP